MTVETVAMLTKIIHQSATNSFKVVQFVECNTAKEFRAAGEFHIEAKSETKQRYRLFGDWTTHSKFGPQFSIQHLEAERPTDLQGLIPFLADNVKGVGLATATKLIEKLNVKNTEEFLDICKNDQKKLYEIFPGKKKKIAEAIFQSMFHDEIYRSVAIFLREHAIPENFVKKIFAKYKEKTLAVLKENPYRLIHDLRRVGFIKADAIGQKLGIVPTSLFRIEAACAYALELALEDGHTCLPRDKLIQKMISVLEVNQEKNIFSFDFVLQELRKIYLNNKSQFQNTFLIRSLPEFMGLSNIPLFYLPEIFHMENEVLTALQLLLYENDISNTKENELKLKLKNNETTFEAEFPSIPWAQLSEEQSEAIKLSFFSQMMILTGGPGCGKTFVLKSIFEMQKKLKREIGLCAPTGLAAKRMSASIGDRAYTLHKLLGLGQKKEENNLEDFDVDADILKKVNLVIVDESSMLSLDLFRALLLSLGPNKKLILVGDADQLPSVGAGNCLKDLINSNQISVVKLTKIFRQSSLSPIPFAARQIIHGQYPKFEFITRNPIFSKIENLALLPCSQDQFFDLLLQFLKVTIPEVYKKHPIYDCQILVPIRKTNVGQENINKFIQEQFNPLENIIVEVDTEKECELQYGNKIRVGDKIIQTKNNYTLKVYNGDLGFCHKISKVDGDIEVVVKFGERFVTYKQEEKWDLQLCYAMTVHKSQGSEFPICIIPMFGCYYTMLDRNLLYTAVTRASQSVILFGEEWAMKKAVETQNAMNRFSALKDLLNSQKSAPVDSVIS